jgi:hypothetical protein
MGMSEDMKCLSADGVEIFPGTEVCHFLDPWSDRGPVLMIDKSHHGFDVIYSPPCRYRVDYMPDLLYATELGLLKNQLANAKKSVLSHRAAILEADARAERLQSQIAALSQQTPPEGGEGRA